MVICLVLVNSSSKQIGQFPRRFLSMHLCSSLSSTEKHALDDDDDGEDGKAREKREERRECQNLFKDWIVFERGLGLTHR